MKRPVELRYLTLYQDIEQLEAVAALEGVQ